MVRRYDVSGWRQIGPRRGTRPGGVYEDESGQRWYVKQPASPHQGRNEVLASVLYRDMDFDAVAVHPTTDGRVVSEWVDGLPENTTASELSRRVEAHHAFLPSALMANWDVVGLEYDNMLPHPRDNNRVVLLDFGGSFDTRAMGGSKPYSPDRIPALDGFLDTSINPTAPRVFEAMSPRLFSGSRDRLSKLGMGTLSRACRELFSDERARERKRTIKQRLDILRGKEYGEVFDA